MARMNPTAKVYGIDIYTPLVKMAEANIRKQVLGIYTTIYLSILIDNLSCYLCFFTFGFQDADLFDSGRVTLAVRNGWDDNLPGAPYDAINVGASADTIPKALLSQLKVCM